LHPEWTTTAQTTLFSQRGLINIALASRVCLEHTTTNDCAASQHQKLCALVKCWSFVDALLVTMRISAIDAWSQTSKSMQSLLVDPKITVLLAAQVKLVTRREIISGGSRRHQPSRVCHIVNPVGLQLTTPLTALYWPTSVPDQRMCAHSDCKTNNDWLATMVFLRCETN
jgi:hypothetical protein